MNSLQKALVSSGLAQAPKERKNKMREYKCRKCGAPMVRIENTNTMACSSCKNFFIFDGARQEK